MKLKVLGLIILIITYTQSAATTKIKENLLTHFLIAELAAKRDLPQIALDHYIIVAKNTNDPKVAELATEYAVELQKPQEAVISAKLWANADSNNLQAQLAAIAIILHTNMPAEHNYLPEYLTRAFAINPADMDEHLLDVFSNIELSARQLLTITLDNLATDNPQNPYIHLASAQIYANQLNITTAEKHLNHAFKLKPDLTNAIQLKAKLIRYKYQDDNKALIYLNQKIINYPHNAKLRMFYISALFDNEREHEAKPHLEKLISHKVYQGEALLLLSEIYINNDQINKAKQLINQAVELPEVTDKAKYFLGQIAEFEKQQQLAIQWYTAVQPYNPHHIPAILRAAFILSTNAQNQDAIRVIRSATPGSFDEQKQLLLAEINLLMDMQSLDEAMKLSNLAVENIPHDVDFLYARSLVANLQSNNKLAEQDLKKVISLEPNNANALNALGYTLAKYPERQQEALRYISKAVELIPNNPAFMDSLGWLLYKMGDLTAAANMLGEAYKLNQDALIAAHLVEVLWKLDQRAVAKKILQQALKNSPEHIELQQTATRLNIFD